MRSTRFIYLLFAMSVIVLAWLGNAYVEENSSAQVKYTEAVSHTYEVIASLRYCEKLLLQAESSQEGFLLSQDLHFKIAAELPLSSLDSVLNELSTLITDNPKQRVNFFLLKKAIRERADLLRNSWNLVVKQKDRPIRLLQAKLLMDKMHLYVHTMETEEDALLLSRNLAKDHYQSLNATFLRYAFMIACLICLLAGLMTVRELQQRARTQKKLEKSIFDLKRSYEEMEQITFTASHDLQEPLRKIRTLISLFRKNYISADHGEEEKEILQRIEGATEKMHTQIQDLVDFSILLDTKAPPKVVDLNKIFAATWKKTMEDKAATLTMETTLPLIRGQEQQLRIAFTELLTNAYTFRSPDRPLAIRVSCRLSALKQTKSFWEKDLAPKFHEITITDNGIGFDDAFNERIFGLFQRLHTQQMYSGKGAGLAQVKRIMTNHYGFAEATGNPGKGASFRLYFPVE